MTTLSTILISLMTTSAIAPDLQFLKIENGRFSFKEKTSTAGTLSIIRPSSGTQDGGQAEFDKGTAAYNLKNYAEALDWFRKAADKGHGDE